ncbi:hypothetical protein [Flavobacterium oreochromis]|uniref:Peptidase C39-like domain-containing protein n=3 Tax=Flavobacterium TaxID=237 RepID=A0A246G778_9FLAO|nr:hypothetical protein [Flavobacterium oreochromis]OWP74209.1 hypothetical protein BWK62_14815 [Flavobacterium oreochromis]
MILNNEIALRKSMPYLANQKNTPLCGMAAINYLLAKQNFDLYEKFVKELHRTGYFKFKNYIVDVEKSSKHLLEMNPLVNKLYPSDYQGIMPYCDWISFSSIRNQENALRDYDGEDDFGLDGATLPNEIVKLMKGILGYTNVVDNSNLAFNKGTLPWDGEDCSAREIAKMEELKNQGYSVVMLINTKMINYVTEKVNGKLQIKMKKTDTGKLRKEMGVKSGFFSTIEHWVVFEEIIGGTINADEFDFKIFTWGELRDVIIEPEVFSTNYYGYVYGK